MVFKTFDIKFINEVKNYCSSHPNFLINSSLSTKLHWDGPITHGKKRAAVMIPMCNVLSTPSILFTLRTNLVSTHKNHVSFPGGHVDQDESMIDAALRETYEEIGDVGPIDIIGIGQTIPSKDGKLVTPVLGFIKNDLGNMTHVIPNPLEVQKVFAKSLSFFYDKSNYAIEELSRNGVKFNAPVYGSGEERIWGLTGMILHGALENVILPHARKEEDNNDR